MLTSTLSAIKFRSTQYFFILFDHNINCPTFWLNFSLHRKVQAERTENKMFSKIGLLAVIAFAGYFQQAESVTCTYEITTNNAYMCHLKNQNVLSENDLAAVDGTHMTGYTDESVTVISETESTIEIFPSSLISRFINLNSVVLSSVGMKTISTVIVNCANLKNLVINNNQIPAIPEGIFINCENLATLSFLNNTIATIHNNAFTGLGSLETLNLQQNNIPAVNSIVFTPISILKSLQLDNNQIAALESEVFKFMPQLTELRLSNNKLTTWNANIVQMNPLITSLQLSGNEIRTLDQNAFTNLINLEKLSIGSLLESIPVFTNLANLQELNLDNNKFKTISLTSFTGLNALKSLFISQNEIETLNFTDTGPQILQQLQVLFLRDNKITNLEENSFTVLKAMTHLDLTGNQLKELRANDIKPTTKLLVLDVTKNKIEKIEKELFANITRLTFRATGNVCTDEDYEINQNFDADIAPKLKECFNFGIMTQANVIVVLAAFLASFAMKML